MEDDEGSKKVEFRTWHYKSGSTGILATTETWEEAASCNHPGFVAVRNDRLAWSPLTKAPSESRVALVSTGGIHLRTDVPFDVHATLGDVTYREIPASASNGSLMITHTRYNHEDADEDINCMFPLERLRELATDGAIGSVASSHYGLMGFIPDPSELLSNAAPAISEKLIADAVDLVVISAGCPMCHRTAALLQNAIEAAGVSTVSVTVNPRITHDVGVPRAVTARFPQGNVFGEAFSITQQRKLLECAIAAAYEADAPGTMFKTPFRWLRGSQIDVLESILTCHIQS